MAVYSESNGFLVSLPVPQASLLPLPGSLDFPRNPRQSRSACAVSACAVALELLTTEWREFLPKKGTPPDFSRFLLTCALQWAQGNHSEVTLLEHDSTLPLEYRRLVSIAA